MLATPDMHGGSRLLGDIPVTGWRLADAFPELEIALTVALTRLQDRSVVTRMFQGLDVVFFCNVR